MQFSLRHIFMGVCILCHCLKAIAQDKYTLQKSLQTARNNNPTLKTEQLNISIAQTGITSAKLRPNPILNNQTLQLIKHTQLFPNTDWYNTKNRQVWWQLTKPFQTTAQRTYKIEVATKNVAYTNQYYFETERNLFAEVSIKWLEVWIAQKKLDIIQIAKTNIDSLIIKNQIRYKNEVITQTDLFRTELLAKQFSIQAKTASQDVINRLDELKLLLGIQEQISVDTRDSTLFTIASNIDNLLAQSLQSRSDIQTIKSLIEVASSNIKLQKSLAFPQPEIGFIWNPQNAIPYFGIFATIELPIFNRNQGEIKKSYLLKEQAEKQLFVTQSKIQTEIKVAFANFQLQQQNLESFNFLLQQSQTILDNVKYAYLKGGTTIVDFLEAQRSWLETQQQYYEANQSYRQSYIQLLYVTGLINQLAQ